MIPVQWIDERAVMAYELGAARFLLEHYFAGTANDHVRQETQAWLDRARGAAIAQSAQLRRETDNRDQPDERDEPNQSDRSGRPGGSAGGSGPSPFDRLGE